MKQKTNNTTTIPIIQTLIFILLKDTLAIPQWLIGIIAFFIVIKWVSGIYGLYSSLSK